MMFVLWCMCKAETVGSIGADDDVFLDNDVASLDVSQGDRTPLDYIAL